jgi:hypothetical protein
LLFIESFHTLLSGSIVLALITNGDGGGKIFGSCCGGVMNVDARSDRAFAGDFGGVTGDCDTFGLGLLWLGFDSPTSAAFSVFTVQ